MTASPVAPDRKRCVVAWATRERQYLWELELPENACVADALEAARARAAATQPQLEVPWSTAAVGIFGEPCERGDAYRDGARIELYRPLQRDPRTRRRERVQRERRGGRARP